MAYENRVGDNFPFETEFAQFEQQVEGVIHFLDTYGVTLTDDERTTRLNPRKGSDTHVELVIKLARKYDQKIPGMTLEGIERDFKMYRALDRLVLSAPNWQKLVDTHRQAGHEYWQGFLAYYGSLTNAARWNADIALAIAPVIKFMTPKRSPKKEEEEVKLEEVKLEEVKPEEPKKPKKEESKPTTDETPKES